MAGIKLRAIIPDEGWDYSVWEREVKDTITMVARPDIRALFKQTVEDWRHKPVFRGTVKKSSNSLRLLVQPTGKNANQWRWVSHGTASRTIVPKTPGGKLKFMSGYSPSTRPGSLSSKKWSRFKPWVSASAVEHPGIEARDFEETIVEAYQDEWEKLMQKATDRAAKRM